MKKILSLFLLTPWLAFGQVSLEFPEGVAEKFGDQIPLELTITQIGDEFKVIAINLTADHLTLTKFPAEWSINHADESPEAESATLTKPVDLQHIVLRPKSNPPNPAHARQILTFKPSQIGAKELELKMTLGGYFPSIKDYVTFSATSTVVIKPHRPEFEKLLKQISEFKGNSKNTVHLFSLIPKDDIIHIELRKQFESDHPALWKAAAQSAGNMHNPKVRPLRKIFAETLLKTPTLQTINEHLRSVGFQIKKVSFEKFGFEKRRDPWRFYSIVSLKLEPLTPRKKKPSPNEAPSHSRHPSLRTGSGTAQYHLHPDR